MQYSKSLSMKLTPLPTRSLKNAAPSRILGHVHHVGMGMVWAGFLGMAGAVSMMLLAIGIPALGVVIPAALPVNGIIILSAAIAASTYAAGAVIATTTINNKDTLPEINARYTKHAVAGLAAVVGLGLTIYTVPTVDPHLRNPDVSDQAAQGRLSRAFAAPQNVGAQAAECRASTPAPLPPPAP